MHQSGLVLFPLLRGAAGPVKHILDALEAVSNAFGSAAGPVQYIWEASETWLALHARGWPGDFFGPVPDPRPAGKVFFFARTDPGQQGRYFFSRALIPGGRECFFFARPNPGRPGMFFFSRAYAK